MGKLAGVSDLREALTNLRDRPASVLDGDVGHRRGCECECGVPPDMRTIPSTAKEYREVLKDLADMPTATGVSPLDEITAARQARQAAARAAAAEQPERPGVRGQQRSRSRRTGGDSGVGS